MKDRILTILQSVNKDITTYMGDALLEDGIIDSFDIIEIVGRLEEELNIEIDADYIVSENFKNVDTIVEMVEHILG